MKNSARNKEQTINAGNAEYGRILQLIAEKIKIGEKINMVCYVYDPLCKGHTALPVGKQAHQESKFRVAQINGAICKSDLNSLMVTSGSVDLTRTDLLRVHSKEYIKHMEDKCRLNRPGHLDPPSFETTFTNIKTLEAIYAAASSVKGAVNLVCRKPLIGLKEIKRKYKKAKKTPPIYKSNRPSYVFCNVRPPGHHAHSDHGSGFCFVNNVVLGARYALHTYPDQIKRVLIIDWDLHHGDGTQELVAETQNSESSILYVSMHRGPDFYPNTGTVEDNQYFSNILNVPLESSTTAAEYKERFEQFVIPRALEYKPDLIMISAGFDSHRDDLYSELPLDYSDFSYLTQRIMDISTTFDCPIVSVLEGGYTLHVLVRSVLAHIGTMIEHSGKNLLN